MNSMQSTAPVFDLAERLYQDEKELLKESENFTDTGNAKRFVRLHGDDIRFCVQWGAWLIWDGSRWKRDDAMAIDRLAESVALNLDWECSQETDKERRTSLRKAAQAAENYKKRRDFLEIAKAMVAVRQDDLDKNPWLVATRNAVIDLKNLITATPRREDLITKRAEVEYVPEAQCPRWTEFLSLVTDGNVDLISYLQRAAGYSLTGVTDERCLFTLWGSGKNGKSTFIETISVILGDYAARTPTETLLSKRYDGIPNDVAALKGARFVHASESKEGRSLSESLVKDITGNDTISARFMRGEWFSFRPEFKLWLGTNHKPIIRETTDAIWDRIRLVPFTVRIPDAKLIPASEVRQMFDEERSGIFNWMLEGVALWRSGGLGTAEAVRAATGSYRSEMDLLGEFLSDTCTLNDTAEIEVGTLFDAYVEWCNSNQERPLKKRAFGNRLLERGFDQYQKTTGKRAKTWTGITLM